MAYWLAHPHIRRMSVVIALVHGLAIWSVCAAPMAAASTGEALLGWTGLRDSYGVPASQYFVSLVSTPEATLNNGQDVSILDPSSWMKWMGQAMETAVTHSTAAWWLTLATAGYVFLVGVSLWLVRFALSTRWLVVIAQIARPVYNAVNTVAQQLYLGPITVTLCVMIGGFHILRGHRGRGWALIGTGALFTVLLLTFFADPIGELYSEHGLLAMGRETGFAIAQATRGNPYAPGQPLEAQLDALVGQLITSAVRQPLQVINFGTVVDDVPGCAAKWSAAIVNADGSGPGPAHAMGPVSDGGCGAVAAMAHAQHLGGGDFMTALVFLFAGLVLSIFLWYVAITNFLVGLKAAYFGTVVGPAFMVGMTGLAERAMAYAKHSAWQLLIHAVELAVYTAFLGVVMVWIGFALTTSALGHGTVSVAPRMLIVMLAAIVAFLLFRFIERQFHSDGIGTISHTVRDAAGTLWQGGRDRYDHARQQVDNARDTAGRLRDRFRRGSRDATDAGADDDTASSSTTPGFDTFNARPQSSRASKKWVAERLLARRSTPAGAAPAAEGAASGSGAAATGAARATTGLAADVAAPEVAIPAAIASGAAHAVHKHHEKAKRRRETDPPGRDEARPSPSARPDNRAERDKRPATTEATETSHDSFSPRPTWRGRRPNDHDDNSGGRDVSPTGYEAPPLDHQREPDSAHAETPALELGARSSTHNAGGRQQ
jgi:hypothetical protein